MGAPFNSQDGKKTPVDVLLLYAFLLPTNRETKLMPMLLATYGLNRNLELVLGAFEFKKNGDRTLSFARYFPKNPFVFGDVEDLTIYKLKNITTQSYLYAKMRVAQVGKRLSRPSGVESCSVFLLPHVTMAWEPCKKEK